MTTDRPRVSMCLLTYGRAHVLPRTLDSLLAQTHANFELIINDDCSPDDTERVCREYERRDSRIRYCKNPRNLRYAGNQNAAILRATTDYVAIVHDGDTYRPQMLEQWIHALVKHPSAAVAFSAADHLDEDGRPIGTYTHAYPPLIPGRQLLDEMLKSPASPIFGITMVRRSCVLQVGPFDTRMPVLADVDMWMRLLAKHDAAYVAEPLYGAAPREAGHHNSYENWRVRREYELIYALNYMRRYPTPSTEARLARQQLLAMLWKGRARQLLACVRHAHLPAFFHGLMYVVRQNPLATTDLAAFELDWAKLRSEL